MKILVTGAVGFIGFHLAKKRLERSDKVVGLDNINDYYDISLKYGRLNSKVSRDFTYTDDIVNEIVKVIDNPAKPLAHSHQNLTLENLPPQVSTAPYRLYNIGNNAPLSLMAFIETLENALGEVAEKNMLPSKLGMWFLLLLMSVILLMSLTISQIRNWLMGLVSL